MTAHQLFVLALTLLCTQQHDGAAYAFQPSQFASFQTARHVPGATSLSSKTRRRRRGSLVNDDGRRSAIQQQRANKQKQHLHRGQNGRKESAVVLQATTILPSSSSPLYYEDSLRNMADGFYAASVEIEEANLEASSASSADPTVSVSNSPSTQQAIRTRKSRLRPLLQSFLHRNKETTKTAVSDSAKDDVSAVPSVKRMMSFLTTTCLIWLSEPLLSLVDTTAVGWFASKGGASSGGAVLQLAAMGPATTWMDTLLYMTYFLAIATTNQVAEHLARRDYRECQSSTSQLLGVALVCGTIVSLITFGIGPCLIKNMCGTGAGCEQIASLASGYTRIRAAVAPISVLGMVAQSFCLVTGRTKAVVQAVAVASVLNCIGDAWLTPIWGLYGASAATAVAGSAASVVLIRQVYKQMKEWRQLEAEQSQREPPILKQLKSYDLNNTIVDLAEISMVATEPVKEVPLVSLPDKKGFMSLLSLSLPLAFNQWAKIGSYAALSVRAAAFGAVALAANNVLTRVFYFLCCLADGLGQAAQAFVPATVYPKFNKKAFQQVQWRLAGIAALAAAFGGTLAKLVITNGASFLARDAGIVAQLRTAGPYLAGSLVLHPFITVLEGTVIAKREFHHLIKTYCVTLATYAGLLKYTCTNVGDIWRSLLLWQVSRLGNYLFWGAKDRFQRRNKTNQDQPKLSSSRTAPSMA